LIELIEIIPQLEWITTNGAFYAFIKLPKEINSWEFARDLIVNKSVLVLPGTIFGETWKSHIRIAYGAVDSDEIDEGINRIKNYLEEST
jgi:aspartate/methionine/tyrosine aminotransferase